MHEIALIVNLLKKVESLAKKNHAKKVIGVTVKMGAMCHLSEDGLIYHFTLASHGTVAQGAKLTIEHSPDVKDPDAQGIQLKKMEFDEG